ncbi:hypothetical protein EZS27_027385 [termite gut metagenome]|uniref:Uncharacterized protein n=1 Tax=termite gut metagenome TaxID=433724 RepID=A0A5J4QQ66_9ZZZZ
MNIRLISHVGATLATARNKAARQQSNREDCPCHAKINLGIITDNLKK